MSHVSSLDWQAHIHAGCKYLKTAQNGLNRSQVFNNELIYQLTAMAIEKLLVGVYQYHRQMPEDHTLDGLVDGLAAFCTLDPNLAESIKEMGRYDDMCPLVPVNRSIPDDTQIKTLLAVGRRVVGFVKLHTRKPAIQQLL